MPPRTGGEARRGFLRCWMAILSVTRRCMDLQLQFATQLLRWARLPDLQYQQVIDNLAKIGANPGISCLGISGGGGGKVRSRSQTTVMHRLPSA